MWHAHFTPAWFDCGCGWPGRLARALGRLLPKGNFHVTNAARHASGPSHVLSLLNAPSGFQHRDSHVFLLDFATYYSSVPSGRALQHQIVDEAILRGLLRQPTRPAVLTLELPPNSVKWRELFERNGSSRAVQKQSHVASATTALSQHYGTTLLSAIRVVAAGLGGDPFERERLHSVFCLKNTFGMIQQNVEVHPGVCLHSLVGEMVAGHFRAALEQHQQLRPSVQALVQEVQVPTSTLYLDRCADASVRLVAQACSQLHIARDSLFFTDAAQVRRRPPEGGVMCARPPPVPIGAAEAVPKHAVVKQGVYRGPESCAAAGQRQAPSWDALGLTCWGWANSSCTPTRSPHWVATYEAHNDFAYYSCGPTLENGGVSHALSHTLTCNVPGFLFVTYLQSYTSNWGVVDVNVATAKDAGEEVVFARAAIDSRDESFRRSLVETASVRLSWPGGGGGGTSVRSVHVSLTPATRPPSASAAGRWPPKSAADLACPSKFKLTALACY